MPITDEQLARIYREVEEAYPLLEAALRVYQRERGDDEGFDYLFNVVDGLYAAPAFTLFDQAESVEAAQRELERLHRMPYGEYLRTDFWRNIRQRALARADGRCQGCSTKDGLEVHHRTYARRGYESLRDLTVLCSTCHGAVHSAAGRIR